MWSYVAQKWCIARLYRRPRCLDESVAVRFVNFLLFLTFLHVCTSTMFYAYQAKATGSEWTTDTV